MLIPGGKGQTFHKLINLMAPHQVYIETHKGRTLLAIGERR